jgi:hypothetical protein
LNAPRSIVRSEEDTRRDLHAENHGDHLLLWVEIHQFAGWPFVGILDCHTDDRIITRAERPPVEKSAGYGAVHQPENTSAFRIPTGIGRASGRAGIEGSHVVVNSGNIGLEPAIEMQSWRIKVTQASTSELRIPIRSTVNLDQSAKNNDPANAQSRLNVQSVRVTKFVCCGRPFSGRSLWP